MEGYIIDTKSPQQEIIQKKWDLMRDEFLFKLIELADEARTIELSKNERIDPCDDPNVLLLEFTFGNFPEEYICPPYFYDPVINGRQAEMIRSLLRPNLSKFYKEAKKDENETLKEVTGYNNDEAKREIAKNYIKGCARIVAFCLGVWPEESTEDVALDMSHMKELRNALRFHSEWILDTFSRSVPPLWKENKNCSKEELIERFSIVMSLGDFHSLNDNHELAEAVFSDEEYAKS